MYKTKWLLIPNKHFHIVVSMIFIAHKKPSNLS